MALNTLNRISALPRASVSDRSDRGKRVSIPITVNEYTIDPVGNYVCPVTLPIPGGSVMSMNSVSFTPNVLTVPDSSYAFTVAYNGTSFSQTVPSGSYSATSMYNYIYSVLLLNGLYLVNAQGVALSFVTLATNPATNATLLTTTPVPTALPTGWTNPQSLALTGHSPQIQFSTSLASFLGGYTAATYYPPSATSTSTSQYSSTGVAQNEITFKLGMPQSMIKFTHTSEASRCLYAGIVPIGNTPVTIAPYNPPVFDVMSSGLQSVTFRLNGSNNNALSLVTTRVVLILDVFLP